MIAVLPYVVAHRVPGISLPPGDANNFSLRVLFFNRSVKKRDGC